MLAGAVPRSVLSVLPRLGASFRSARGGGALNVRERRSIVLQSPVSKGFHVAWFGAAHGTPHRLGFSFPVGKCGVSPLILVFETLGAELAGAILR